VLSAAGVIPESLLNSISDFLKKSYNDSLSDLLCEGGTRAKKRGNINVFDKNTNSFVKKRFDPCIFDGDVLEIIKLQKEVLDFSRIIDFGVMRTRFKQLNLIKFLQKRINTNRGFILGEKIILGSVVEILKRIETDPKSAQRNIYGLLLQVIFTIRADFRQTTYKIMLRKNVNHYNDVWSNINNIIRNSNRKRRNVVLPLLNIMKKSLSNLAENHQTVVCNTFRKNKLIWEIDGEIWRKRR